MAFMDDLKKFGKNISQKTGDMVEVTKLNSAISQEKEKIRKLYYEIGTAIYEQYKTGNNPEVEEKCAQIAEIEQKIEELQQKIQEIKSSKKCPGCGTEVSTDTAFCPQCGTKLN
ncbi:MAG TPA: zinc-ribbon domain-containing protein [Clostridia bacterium]